MSFSCLSMSIMVCFCVNPVSFSVSCALSTLATTKVFSSLSSFLMTTLSAVRAALQMSSNESSSVIRGQSQSSFWIFCNNPGIKIFCLASSSIRLMSLCNASVWLSLSEWSHDMEDVLPFGFLTGQ